MINITKFRWYDKYNKVSMINNINNNCISFKVLRWRALLRHTNYLVKFAGRSLAYNMYGEPLHPDVISIIENAREKRIQYFNLWWENGVVSRGDILFLRVSDCEMHDLLFQYEDENDNFWISEYNVNTWSQLALGSALGTTQLALDHDAKFY